MKGVKEKERQQDGQRQGKLRPRQRLTCPNGRAVSRAKKDNDTEAQDQVGDEQRDIEAVIVLRCE
jgi:hypothetical protein